GSVPATVLTGSRGSSRTITPAVRAASITPCTRSSRRSRATATYWMERPRERSASTTALMPYITRAGTPLAYQARIYPRRGTIISLLSARNVMRRNHSTDEAGSGSNLRFLLRALRHRNYRLFFGGQGVSLIGTWMTRIATGWLVYRLTGSAFLLGIVSFASQLPTLLLSPFAGVWVDRLDRHRVLVVT